MNKVIGTCSLCGGRVLTPNIWHGINPPVPHCESCKALPANHGPVIEMKPVQRIGGMLTSPPLGSDEMTRWLDQVGLR